ncbi:uncharacterized protein BDR25DRAFT_94595 [Lindgomyces ingoldianus]|uniref:Uncharacterized protein n=1 Tax=Lindgomyces ingoldianus TaxID=673940 RepID=A0ACB6QCJ7_9PLEO|nr:uncharacterized protein BDR25DRAFT_94595 [Lindgomyces ingoldianus]KAF2464673.1 hypothetical protein BDR25DRAFT_94595 [Lindgomyces ingoldianus]
MYKTDIKLHNTGHHKHHSLTTKGHKQHSGGLNHFITQPTAHQPSTVNLAIQAVISNLPASEPQWPTPPDAVQSCPSTARGPSSNELLTITELCILPSIPFPPEWASTRSQQHTTTPSPPS